MSRVVNYDEVLKKVPYKYALPIIVAKRSEALIDFAKPYVSTEDNYPVSIALKEIEKGYIKLKNEEILKFLLPEVK